MSARIVIFTSFAASMAFNGILLTGRLDGWCVPALLAGWFLADAASGLVHVVMDYIPCPGGLGLADMFFYPGSRESPEYLALRQDRWSRLTPFQRIAYDFKNHHPRPDALGRRSLWFQIGSTLIVAALPASLALNLMALYGHAPGWLIAGGMALILGSAFAQHFHGSQHMPSPPAHIRAMRALGLLMSPAAHQLHHDTLQRDFATNCGWSNPLINVAFRLAMRREWIREGGLVPPP